MVSKRFILKRLLLLIPVLLGVGTLVFGVLHLSPGNPARVILGQRADQAAVDQLERQLGLNDPIYVQYGRFLVNAVQLEFGQSYKVFQGQNVKTVLLDKLPVTVEMALYGQAFGILFGIPLGILSAVKQDSIVDHATRIGALTGISVPIFWSGPLLILLFATFLNLLPTSGRIGATVFLDSSWQPFTILPEGFSLVVGPVTIAHATEWPLTGMVTIDTLLLGNVDAFISASQHLLLPCLVIGIYSMALISRMMRSSMLEVVRQDYMRTARAKGQGAKITIMKHGLRNALIPVVTVIGIQFGTLLGGAVLTETVFGIGGIGVMLVNAIEVNDYNLVQGTVLTFALLFTLVNLVVDITYSYLDPRIQQ
jgi:peptide/nickel transport system permease protein